MTGDIALLTVGQNSKQEYRKYQLSHFFFTSGHPTRKLLKTRYLLVDYRAKIKKLK